ncbi:hypothetical protein PybrP1_006517 [[Pythium] brassicae (nom. inval.)]|nr:hypothetical protein PybrP1_006517 [[Pythium] brassicae (nom. inval.)]
MADYEGFLLLHDLGRYADPLYFELESGVLAYYSKKGGRWLGEYSLTRHRVVARVLPNAVGAAAADHSPNRFMIELCPVRSVHDTERSLKGCRRATVMLSGSSPDVARRWVHAIQTWRRRNWRDSVVIADFEDEYKALRLFMTMHKLEPKITRTVVEAPEVLRKIAVAPEHIEPAPEKRGLVPELEKRSLLPEQDDSTLFTHDKRNHILTRSISTQDKRNLALTRTVSTDKREFAFTRTVSTDKREFAFTRTVSTQEKREFALTRSISHISRLTLNSRATTVAL